MNANGGPANGNLGTLTRIAGPVVAAAVILPAENRRDLRDVPANVRKGLKFHFVKSVGDLCRVLFPKTCARRSVPEGSCSTRPARNVARGAQSA